MQYFTFFLGDCFLFFVVLVLFFSVQYLPWVGGCQCMWESTWLHQEFLLHEWEEWRKKSHRHIFFSAYLNRLGNTKEKIIIWTPTDRGPTHAFHVYIEKAGVIQLCCCNSTISSNLESPFLSYKGHITFCIKASTGSGAIWDQLWLPIATTVIWQKLTHAHWRLYEQWPP